MFQGVVLVECLIENKETYSKKIEQVLRVINEEFEEHLLSINENTSEIQENSAYLYELDNKISKLNERISDIYMILSKMTGKKLRKMPAFEDIDPLTEKEKLVFLNLYTEEKPITFTDLSNKLNMSIELTRQYIISLIEKGIPIQKTFKNTRPYLLLDQKFKNLQAKKNILKIEQKILV